MSKRNATIITVYLAAALLLVGSLAMVQHRRLNQAQLREQRIRELALEELCAAVSGLDVALEKSRYALSPGLMVSLCAETQSRAQAAAAALGVLPLQSQEVEETAAFLARAGDYAAYLLRKVSAGESCTGEERDSLRLLAEGAGLLADNLTRLRSDVAAGAVGLSAMALESRLPTLSGSMVQMEQAFPELPSLVYDGPFSNADPEAMPPLADSAAISQNDALIVGAGFLRTRPNLAQCQGQTAGAVPVWRIRSGDYTAHVSVQGGHALRILCDRSPGRGVLTPEDAREKAAEHLRSRGFASMTECDYSIYNNVITVSYCYEKNRVLYYPDMVKVAVYMDNGDLAGLDAESYVRSHTQREKPAATIPEHEARTLVDESLTILSQRLAVIPTPGGNERLCYEFRCENPAGEHYLLYVNAVTGQQEHILILLEDENGTLAI